MSETAGLPGHAWKRRYESPPDNLIEEFYVPALGAATRYDRAVGFFSSALLAAIAPSIDDFVIRGGMMRLITSPAHLSDADLLAMGKGEDIRERLRSDLVLAVARPLPGGVLKDRLSLLTWMVATGRLEVHIALRELPDSYALFHEKIGVLEDDLGNWMTLTRPMLQPPSMQSRSPCIRAGRMTTSVRTPSRSVLASMTFGTRTLMA
jgi:hypothetical protein